MMKISVVHECVLESLGTIVGESLGMCWGRGAMSTSYHVCCSNESSFAFVVACEPPRFP